MDQTSESLLTQILYLVQELHSDMAVYDERLTKAETLTRELQSKIEHVIDNAFPNGDLQAHKAWHSRRTRGPIKRFILKLVS